MKPNSAPPPLDLAALRDKLRHQRGPQYWRSLEEAAETPAFKEMLLREFPAGASEFLSEVGRREFLKLIGASLALAGVGGCTRQPLQKIVPYIQQPENMVMGEPLFYATATTFQGFAQGILVKSREGHPIKIEGNDEHPISLGGTNIFMQACLLDLYDPDRAQAVSRGMEVSDWGQFLSALEKEIFAQKTKQGAGLRILTETVYSPTLRHQLDQVRKAFPAARIHRYDPINRDHVYQGARLAFGETVETHYAFDKAAVVLALNSDFLFTHPAGVRYARHFADGRRVASGLKTMNRLYAADPSPRITGSMADHRLPLRPDEIPALAAAVARRLGIDAHGIQGALAPEHGAWVEAVAADLQAHRGASIVIAGEGQPPPVHALCHAMNEALGNFGKTISFTAAPGDAGETSLESLRQLDADLVAGKVDFLLILGGNPAFDAPVDFRFAEKAALARQSAHLSVNRNETSGVCTWHIPETHFLENWSDARAIDGTVSVCQPLIAPFYDGISAHELLGALLGLPAPLAYDVVRDYWSKQHRGTDFERFWRVTVHDGVMAGTAAPTKTVTLKKAPFSLPAPNEGGVCVNFEPDPTLWDGRYANNGWLQELAKPLTKVSWENPALVSPGLAQEHRLKNGDIVEIRHHERLLQLPVWITPGHAERCITVHLGNGRTEVGRVGTGVGSNGYRLRGSDAMWFGGGADLRKTEYFRAVASTQMQHNIHGEERQVLRAGTLADFLSDPKFIHDSIEEPPVEETLYNAHEHDFAGYKWGMSIDLSTCIGCNACILGCQSENNIPVVGKDQVARGRSLQWIRIDSYFKGNLDHPETYHVPTPCMQCENAPCELVCPVGATLHDHEGLNLQVYNRCVGTRFCSNNCPYKVRRFNFLFYAESLYHTPSLKGMLNPEVTVRWRGVMEKCTYCIQRIAAARINAEKADRRLTDGEITPACAQACPTRAIVFGDLNDSGSRVSKLQRNPLTYGMLAELNTRPRTTYLSKLSNPNPKLEEPA